MADETQEPEETQEPTAETPDEPTEPSATEVAPPPAPVAEDETAATGVPELTLGSDAGAEAEEGEELQTAALIRGRVDERGVAMGTGRRKTAVARVRVRDGEGKVSINGRLLDEYFPVERDRLMVQAPLKATQTLGKVDVWVRVQGGGTTGQAGAVILGIARALQAKDPSLHHSLSVGGYLTRDGRMVERKKYGYKKARRSFQFSKR